VTTGKVQMKNFKANTVDNIPFVKRAEGTEDCSLDGPNKTVHSCTGLFHARIWTLLVPKKKH